MRLHVHVCTCVCISSVIIHCLHMVYVKKNATLKKNCAPPFDKKCATLLWFASEFVREAYCDAFNKRATIFVEHATIRRNEPQSLNPDKHFTRRHSFRNSVKVRRTQRDKRSAWYTALISATAACLLHSS